VPYAAGSSSGIHSEENKLKDALGNELQSGDLVALQLERPLIFGRIRSVENVGLIAKLGMKGEPQSQLGRMVIDSVHTIEVDMRGPVGAVLALRGDVRSSNGESDAKAPRPGTALDN
jgi:hypothetical protein